MFLYPNGNAVTVVPRVRCGDDGNVYLDMYPHGFIVMAQAEAMAVRDAFNKALRDAPSQLRKDDLKQVPLFAGRETPAGRTDFDKEDDATGA